MRIAYFDEAGIGPEKQEPFTVVAGVLTHGDEQWKPVEFMMENTKREYAHRLPENFAFHAKDLFYTSKHIRLSRAERHDLIKSLLYIIKVNNLPVSYGAVNRSLLATKMGIRAEKLNTLAHQLAFALCGYGLQGWFDRQAIDEVAIAVADRNASEVSLKSAFALFRKVGFPADPKAMLFSFIDALHFAALSESIGLQLADVLAFFIKRHIMKKQDSEEFYELIEPNIICKPESALWPPLEDD